MRSGEQLRLVELAFGRASRKAEAGADVVLLVDSISRIAVASDDPGRVKPIFGAGRETAEEGVGSLTVVATTLGDGGEDQGGVERIAGDDRERPHRARPDARRRAGIYPAIDFTASRIARRGADPRGGRARSRPQAPARLGSLTTEAGRRRGPPADRRLSGQPAQPLGSIRT